MIGFDQILPSLQSLGLWSYWIVGLICLLEAFMLTGLFVPGFLAILTAGMLAEQGVVDFFDMAWFIAIGSALGGEGSFQLGRLTARGLKNRAGTGPSRQADRAQHLFRAYGGFAMVIGRFLGPVSGFVAFAAAMAGMAPRRFLWWNLASAAAQALALLMAGYFLGNTLTTLGSGSTRIILFVGAVFAALLVLWFLITRIWRGLPFVYSLLKSVVQAIRDNPDVAAWGARHPHIARLVVHRFDASRFSGLMTSILAGTFAYVLVLFLGLAWDVMNDGQIVPLDHRLATLLFAFRDETLIRFFTFVTAIGDRKTVTTLLVGLSLALWLRKKRGLLPGLWIGIVSSATTVAFLKLAFARPRPELGYFVESSLSFPSGHAASSVASFGLMIFVLWRVRWIGGFSAGLVAATIIFLIGLSRVYLIEHYLSDVLGGYLIGTLWVIIAIGIMEWQQRRNPPEAHPQTTLAPRWGLALVAGLTLAGAGYFTMTYSKERHIPDLVASPHIVSDIPALFANGNAPAMSETILGIPQEPISLIIIAPDIARFTDGMVKSGWVTAEKPGLASMGRAAWAAWNNLPDDDAPVTPSFWNAEPNDWGFQKTTTDQSLRQRHHARFWQTPFKTKSGEFIIVGTASFDDGLKWGVTHHIDPNIDAERDTLVADMLASGAFTQQGRFQIVAPRLGQNFAGDPWFTDGKAVLLTAAP